MAEVRSVPARGAVSALGVPIAHYEVLNHCQREQTRRKHFRPAVIELLADARLKHDDLLEAQSRWLEQCIEKAG